MVKNHTMYKLYKLAENENILVKEEHRGLPESIRSFFYRECKFNLICLEKRLNRTNKRIVFAEELGHFFTSYGDTLNLSKPDFNILSKTEYLARKWAAEFLVPDRIFKRLLINNLFDMGIYDIAENLGVNIDFLQFSMKFGKGNLSNEV